MYQIVYHCIKTFMECLRTARFCKFRTISFNLPFDALYVVCWQYPFQDTRYFTVMTSNDAVPHKFGILRHFNLNMNFTRGHRSLARSPVYQLLLDTRTVNYCFDCSDKAYGNFGVTSSLTA